MGANAGGRLGFGNPTEENQTHVTARLATEYISEKRMSAKSPYYPVGDKQEASIRANEIAFTDEGMRNQGAFMGSDAVEIATALNGWGEDEQRLLNGMPEWLIEEAIMDTIRVVGVTWSEVDYEPSKFGIAPNKTVALITSGKVTLPAFFNFAPGDLVEVVPHEIPDRFAGRPNGIPHTKVILVAKPYEPEKRSFAAIFQEHAMLRIQNHDVYRQLFSKMHSTRGLEREAAWKSIEEALLTFVVYGAYLREQRGGLTSAQMMNALGLETSDPADPAVRKRVLKGVMLPETELFSDSAVGGDGNNNPNILPSGDIDRNSAGGRLLNAQLNASRKLAGGMATFHRMQQDRILGTAVTGAAENGVVDVSIKQ